MADYRIVQCFGVKRRPKKPAEQCRNRYLWIAKGASAGQFGRKGAQACPNCGSPPEFRHPLNQALGGDITMEEAEALMPEYRKLLQSEKKA
jgi:hypothetical protein